MNFMQRFVFEHPGWGLAYLVVIAVFVLTFAQILTGGVARKKEGD